jgi:hypothetical protein
MSVFCVIESRDKARSECLEAGCHDPAFMAACLGLSTPDHLAPLERAYQQGDRDARARMLRFQHARHLVWHRGQGLTFKGCDLVTCRAAREVAA